jgi:hypothetical protein
LEYDGFIASKLTWKGAEVIVTQEMPELPDGWSYEQGSAGDYIVHIVWPKHGAMSLDFKNRSMGPGWCSPRRASHDEKAYAGRSWKTDFVNEAVNRLRAAWA